MVLRDLGGYVLSVAARESAVEFSIHALISVLALSALLLALPAVLGTTTGEELTFAIAAINLSAT
jgi:hypothetical protein